MPRPVDAVKARTLKRIDKKKLPPNLAASEVLVDGQVQHHQAPSRPGVAGAGGSLRSVWMNQRKLEPRQALDAE